MTLQENIQANDALTMIGEKNEAMKLACFMRDVLKAGGDGAALAALEANRRLTGVPGNLSVLSSDQQNAIVELLHWACDGTGLPGWGVVKAAAAPPEMDQNVWWATLRGDLPLIPTAADERGIARNDHGEQQTTFLHAYLALRVTVVWIGDAVPVCDHLGDAARWFQFDSHFRRERGYIEEVIPDSHLDYNLATLRPWPKSPVPITQQEKYIAMLKSTYLDDLNGWMLLGGLSKTTWVCTWIKDVLSSRLMTSIEEDSLKRDRDLFMYRINVPRWLAEMNAWTTRDFKDAEAKPPAVTVEAIERAYGRTAEGMRFRPILLLEELDSLRPTEARVHALFDLVNAVHERAGLIITTTNATMDELRQLLALKPALLRRLNGDFGDAEKYLVWDLHRDQPKPKR
jgi:hypothetical protein